MKTRFSKGILTVFALAGVLSADALPLAHTVRYAQGRREAVIRYSLDAAAVVTFDVQTNGVSIGAAHLTTVTGDVFKELPAGDGYTIRWNCHADWPGHVVKGGALEFVVYAWALSDKPDYMVVDLNALKPDCVRYYPGVEWLPGGLLANDVYRTTSIVMRRIHARNWKWAMGGSDSLSYPVTLTNDYYIGVFETTQCQWTNVFGTSVSAQRPGAMRPMENVSYWRIREDGANSAANPEHEWPNPPAPDSYLGLLRERTGVDFDLPSEAEWEFAGNAGMAIGYYNTGDCYKSYKVPGRWKDNGGSSEGTADVGSYEPNAFGLYDFHGNVAELCLDWCVGTATSLTVLYDDISTLYGAVNAHGAYLADGVTPPPAGRVRRGNTYNQGGGSNQSLFIRKSMVPRNTDQAVGFRLRCRMGLR